MSDRTVILWFRQDLRLEDNSALVAAVAEGARILPLYIWAPAEAEPWAPGGAARWWLHHALKDLERQLEDCGGRLIFRSGRSLETLETVLEASGAEAVYWNRRYDGASVQVDGEIKRALKARDVAVRSFNSSMLVEPHTVRNKQGSPYKVYTPFWRAIQSRELEKPARYDQRKLRFAGEWPASDPLNALGLLDAHPWHMKLEDHWDPTRKGAEEALRMFAGQRLDRYKDARDLPGIPGTSALSPFLHWGQVGPREIVERLQLGFGNTTEGALTFLKELFWREFAYHVLHHFPHTAEQPLRAEYADFPWEADPETLKRWQRGQTGIPIVDAGMRQLWSTGWMHNRVRMIVASLLVKQLLQHWRQGADWFWDTLVDADLASNTLGWQWSGGCGADAAPYFRVFNPVLQGRKFDPGGDYVKRFVPELRNLPEQFVHAPWEASAEILSKVGVELGIHYPEPIIELKQGRERALKAFESFNNNA